VNALVKALIGVAALALFSGGMFFAGTQYAAKTWQKRMDDYTAQVTAKTQEIQNANAKALAAAAQDKAAAASDYERKMRVADGNYQSVLRLLHDANADRSRLKAAAAAPSECSGYAAPPSRLSDEDAEVALAIAKDGDDAIFQLQLCQREYSSLVDRLNAAN